MTDNRYKLRWHKHQNHLKQMLQEIRNKESTCDVTLVCDDGTEVKAHQIVLRTSSPLLESLLQENCHQNSAVYLTGIQPDDLDSLIEFMYCGEVSLPREKINELIDIAHNLQVKELCNYSKLIVGNENVVLFEKPDENETPTKDETFKTEPEQIGSGQVKCKECGKDFSSYSKKSSRSSLYKHINQKHRGQIFPCNQCDYTAGQLWDLKRHIKLHKIIRHPCLQCDYHAFKIGPLDKHIKDNHPGYLYPCSRCDFKTTKPHAIRKHRVETHKILKHSCDYCDYTTNIFSYLTRHQQFEHPVLGAKVKDPKDDDVDAAHIEKFKKKKNTGPHICKCGREYMKRCTLLKHFRNKHLG